MAGRGGGAEGRVRLERRGAGAAAALLRCAQALHAQVARSAACNGRHGLEERFARWLLMAHDRADGDVFPLTQEFASLMLGVRDRSLR